MPLPYFKISVDPGRRYLVLIALDRISVRTPDRFDELMQASVSETMLRDLAYGCHSVAAANCPHGVGQRTFVGLAAAFEIAAGGRKKRRYLVFSTLSRRASLQADVQD